MIPAIRRTVIGVGGTFKQNKQDQRPLEQGNRSFPVRDQKGSVLLALIITLIILSVLAAAILPTLFTVEMGQVSASGAMRAHYLAEAGGRYVLPRLESIAPGIHTFKFSGGETFFQIKKLSDTEFTSTGIVHEGTSLESRVTLTYTITGGGYFDYGVFGDGPLTFENDSLVDSYSSSGQTTDGQNGDVGTNGDTITVASGAHIYGEQEFLVGRDMGPETFPDGADSMANRFRGLLLLWLWLPGMELDLGGGEYYVDTLYLSNNAILNITGDAVIYVGGPTTVANNGRITISSGASLTIYSAGNMSFASNFIGNPSQPPGSCIIYGTSQCDSIGLGNDCNTHMAIYAPTANITVGNNAVVYGALVGDTVTVQNNGQIHYDEDLLGVGSGGDGFGVEQYFKAQ